MELINKNNISQMRYKKIEINIKYNILNINVRISTL